MTAVRLLEDLNSFEKLALIDMSYSRLDSYDMCSAKYFFTYIQHEPRGFGEAAALGNIVHSVLEAVDWHEPLDLGELLKGMEEFRPKHDPEEKIPDELLEVGHNILGEFVDRHDGEKPEVVGVEVPFAIVVGCALICGYIDRIDRDSQGLHIIDYKTGKYEVAAKRIHENLQLGIYALAMSKMFPGEQIRAELYYLRSGKRKGHVFTSEELDDIEQKLIAKVDQVINDRHFPYTSNTRICSFCEHRKSGACAVGVKRYGGTD